MLMRMSLQGGENGRFVDLKGQLFQDPHLPTLTDKEVNSHKGSLLKVL